MSIAGENNPLCVVDQTAGTLREMPAMVCDAPRSLRMTAKWSISSTVWPGLMFYTLLTMNRPCILALFFLDLSTQNIFCFVAVLASAAEFPYSLFALN